MVEIIRAAHPDLLAIHDLAHQIWPVTFREILSEGQIKYMMNLMYSMDTLEELHEKENHHFILALKNKERIGFALYHPKNDPNSIYRLSKIYIHPRHSCKGVGKKLIDYIINDIVGYGATILELNVNRHNKAVGFYKKLGFRIVGEANIDIGEGYFMNDYVMQLQITQG